MFPFDRFHQTGFWYRTFKFVFSQGRKKLAPPQNRNFSSRHSGPPAGRETNFGNFDFLTENVPECQNTGAGAAVLFPIFQSNATPLFLAPFLSPSFSFTFTQVPSASFTHPSSSLFLQHSEQSHFLHFLKDTQHLTQHGKQHASQHGKNRNQQAQLLFVCSWVLNIGVWIRINVLDYLFLSFLLEKQRINKDKSG